MNRVTVIGLALLVMLATPIVSANQFYLLPDNSSVTSYGDCTNVRLMLNVTTPDVHRGMVSVLFDSNCAEVTGFTLTCGTCFNHRPTIVIVPGRLTLAFSNETPGYPPSPSATSCSGPVHLGNFTICCNTTSPPCQTGLDFYVGLEYMWTSGLWDTSFDPVPFTRVNGTFTCGTTPSEETFSKPIYDGWNLISLPLVPKDNSASAVLSTVSHDAVYQYNATAAPKQFEAIESTDAMNPGTGYFVHATAECIWEYSGTAYSSMSTPLEPGLNMVGWLNCSKDVGDTLSSISGDYYYVARWNTSAEKFEVCNPAAPSAFNDDFATMNRGTGYFISAKQGCTLSESC